MKKPMINLVSLFLLTLLTGLGAFSCQEESLEGDPDVPVPSDIAPPIVQQAYTEEERILQEVDSLTRRMYIAYNTKIIYKWDRKAVGNVSSYPPELRKVPAYLQLMEQMFFAYIKNAYNDEDEGGGVSDTRGLAFLRENLPVTFLLLGEAIGAQNGGISAAGLAQSNLKIFLTDVNGISLDDPDWLEQQHNTFHHEFAHILDRRYNRPKGFDNISAGKYIRTAAWQNITTLEAFSRGFIEPYGASAEAEDFATIVGEITTSSRGSVAGTLESSERLRSKYQLILKFYRELGVDIQGLGDDFALQRRELEEGGN